MRWCYPEVELAHPLDGGRAGVLLRSPEETAQGMDEPSWASVFGRLHVEDVADDVLGPVVHLPRHPLRLARFGAVGALPATIFARRFRSAEARALFAGCAAHSFRPLSSPLTSSFGLMLAASGHDVGWPFPQGGSAAISSAMASVLAGLGGRIETGVQVTQLPDADLVLLDVAPRNAVGILGDRLPSCVRRSYERFRHGTAAFKVDFAVSGGVPWSHPAARRAGTVHVGGTIEQVAAAERDAAHGRMPARPFVLVAQQYLADPTRSAGDVHPVWAYAHVPNGYDGNATDAVVRQIERFAPGFRDRIVAQVSRGPAELEAYNPNYVGGDIATGSQSPRQVVFRPRVTLNPYWTGVPGVYLCSPATPPGGGVHGMCGHNAAKAALRHLRRRA